VAGTFRVLVVSGRSRSCRGGAVGRAVGGGVGGGGVSGTGSDRVGGGAAARRSGTAGSSPSLSGVALGRTGRRIWSCAADARALAGVDPAAGPDGAAPAPATGLPAVGNAVTLTPNITKYATHNTARAPPARPRTRRRRAPPSTNTGLVSTRVTSSASGCPSGGIRSAPGSASTLITPPSHSSSVRIPRQLTDAFRAQEPTAPSAGNGSCARR